MITRGELKEREKELLRWIKKEFGFFEQTLPNSKMCQDCYRGIERQIEVTFTELVLLNQEETKEVRL